MENKLTSIEIPDSVKSIGEFAFSYNYELKDVDPGEGLVSIGDFAFGANDALHTIELPGSLTSLHADAFIYSGAKKTIIPDNPLFDIASLPDVEIIEKSSIVAANQLIGTNKKDKLKGTNGADIILGYGGSDKINGKKGDDLIDPGIWTKGKFNKVKGSKGGRHICYQG